MNNPLPSSFLYVPGPINLGNGSPTPAPAVRPTGTPPPTPRPTPIPEDRLVPSLPPAEQEAGNDLARWRQAVQLNHTGQFNHRRELTVTPQPGATARASLTNEGNRATGEGRSAASLTGRLQGEIFHAEAGAEASVNNQGRGQQQAHIQVGVRGQAGGVGGEAEARLTQRRGSGQAPTTRASARARLATQDTELSASVAREIAQGRPTITEAEARFRQRLGNNVTAEMYYRYRLQQGQGASQTFGAEVSAELDPYTRVHARGERTQPSHGRPATSVHVGVTRQI